MEQIYDVLVKENDTAKAESVFERFGIGLDDWSRSPVFEVQGERMVLYTVACNDETYESVVIALKV